MASQLNYTAERGNALILAVFLVLLLTVMGVTLIDSVTAAKGEVRATSEHQQRLFLAESALDAALQNLEAGGTGQLGTAGSPLALGSGSVYTQATHRGDGTITVFAVGTVHGHSRTIRARVRRVKSVFHHAIFAGNSSGDPSYQMKFGGVGIHADRIHGDVYSGGGILVEEHATLDGTVRASGTITGTEGQTGAAQPGFDFSGVNWTDPAIVDVAAAFAKSGVRRSGAPGGTADELPASNEAHIFRRNPSDRTTETNGTAKNDYFLEDPYESTSGQNGRSSNGGGSVLSIGDGKTPTHVTYYIDGNLWVHNKSALSYQIATSAGGGTQVSFIVRGNIYFSDDLRIQDTVNDAVGFVALKDPDVADTGNIYLGDPRYGTIEELDAFLYAENDFYDVNLDAQGSKAVRILGAMTAGNHVAIDRTYKGGHSRLTVDWDQRLQAGAVTLPFLSENLPGTSGPPISLEAWVESPIVPLGALGGDAGGVLPPVLDPILDPVIDPIPDPVPVPDPEPDPRGRRDDDERDRRRGR